MDTENIICILQHEFRVIPHFDSEFLSHSLTMVENIHRFLICAEKGTFEFLLAELPAKNHWIIFAGDPVEESIEFNLSLIERLKADDYLQRSLYYLVTEKLADIKKVSGSGLWDLGASLALPLRQVNNETVHQAIKHQINVRSSQPRIVADYGCFLLAHQDGYGVNVIWSSDWEFSSQTLEWAKELEQKYPSKGNGLSYIIGVE